jgi:hypothetical protein
MADDKYTEKLSMSDIFKNLLSCSDEQSILEKTIHVYDAKELQTGWQTAICNVKYIACPTGERRAEQASPSLKSESSKKRNKKVKAKEEHENDYKYDKCKSLGVLSYDVPSWRTIIDPETCTYIQRPHPCLYFTATAVGDLRRLTFVDPAGVLDQHLGGFVQRQRARNGFQTGFGRLNNAPLQNDSNVEINVKHYNRLQMPLNHLKPLVEEKSEFWPDNLVTTSEPKPQILKPLPVTSWKGNLQTSSITLTTKNLPPVLLPNKCSTIDRKTGRIHRDILHSQKIKLAPFKPPFTPVKYVQPNRKQKQKLNWLPITTTSACLSRNTGQSEVGKPAWSKMVVLSHDPIN